MYKTLSASAQPKGTPYWICPLGMVDELTLCIIKSKLDPVYMEWGTPV